MSSTHHGEQMNCANCQSAIDNPIVCISHKQGFHIPSLKCETNFMLFILKGQMLITSKEYPGVTLEEGQFILQSIASKLELMALTDVDCIYFRFNNPELFCHERYEYIINQVPIPTTYTPLKIGPEMYSYLNGIQLYVANKRVCSELLLLKRKEIGFILGRYYSNQDLASLLHPLAEYQDSFQYFVLQNHFKAKTVEELAEMGGYTVTTFRRIFRALFKEPAYEWMLKKRKEAILNALYNSQETISSICFKYGFESLSHFSNFCKKFFDASPRNLRRMRKEAVNSKEEKDIHADTVKISIFLNVFE